MVRPLQGISDSHAGVLENPSVCAHCGASIKVGRGTCVNCLLLGAADDAGEASGEEFARVLGEADVPDQHWRLGNYQILGELGRGGMGVIYRARQRHSRRVVALKRVLGDHVDSHERLERFRREAEAAASLDHPNILPIYEVSESAEGFPFFSMKYATGGSLREVGPSLRHDPRACVRLMGQVARAIEYAHGRGVLHRDLQPGNILLDGRGQPLVSDFGLAKMLDDESNLTRTLSTFGTPGFIAPEQAEGPASEITAAADIYSLGATLFNLLAGRPPFVGDNALSVIRQAAEKEAPRLRALRPDIDRDLETIVARALERDPKARYLSAGDLAEDLERWLDGRPIQARRILPPLRAWRWSRRNPVLAGAGSACLLLAVAVVWLLHAPPPPAPLEISSTDKTLAVLPFTSLNRDKDDEFFAVGIQEDILTNLSKVADLKVINQGSVRRYRADEPRDLREIGRALGVRHVLEGSVRQSENRVRISAHLVDTETGSQLWAEQYDRGLQDVFAIQSEIAKKIVDQLSARLSPNEQATIQAKPTDDIVAYELYLRAKDIAQRAGLSTAERTEKQIKLLDEAVARDPAFVPALCLLARVHVLSYWSNHEHTAAGLEAAHRALDRAAALKPDAGEVHLTRGIVHYWGHRDYAPALAELNLASKALPNDADVPLFVGLIQRRQGKWELSTKHLEVAQRKDPRNDTVLFELARTNYFALKRYDDAARTFDAVLGWNPKSFDFQLARAKVDLASRADLKRWQEVVWGEAAKYADADLLAFERLDLALAQRDYRSAEKTLATDQFPQFNWAGYVTPRAYYAGLIAQGLGQTEKAQTEFLQAKKSLAAIVAERPDDAKAHIVLSQIEARLGSKAEAIAEGERAMELRSVTRDAVDGPNIMGLFAGVCALVGEKDRALDILEVAARLPNVTNYGALQLDQTWDSLRGDSRFEKIVASLAPK
ncbi:MAG: protein kinase [Verrucomicrobiota bacterium]|nr:protein kinase [Verrucomicrobiota bacterium]